MSVIARTVFTDRKRARVVGDADPYNDPKMQKQKYLFQIFFPCNNSDTTGV